MADIRIVVTPELRACYRQAVFFQLKTWDLERRIENLAKADIDGLDDCISTTASCLDAAEQAFAISDADVDQFFAGITEGYPYSDFPQPAVEGSTK